MRIAFIRHPQTLWNEQKLFQGTQEGDISESGKLATAEFIKKLKKEEKNKNIFVITSGGIIRTIYLETIRKPINAMAANIPKITNFFISLKENIF